MLSRRMERAAARSLVEVDELPLRSSDRRRERDFGREASKKRLLFVIAHLGAGGAQRVAANAANILVERGFDVHVVVLNQRANAYRLDPRVVIHSNSARQTALPSFDADPAEPNSAPAKPDSPAEPVERVGFVTSQIKTKVPAAFFNFAVAVLSPVAFVLRLARLTVTLRRRIKGLEPDAVLSFLTQTNILTVLATRGLDTHTVISERNDPRLQRHRPGVEFVRRVVYRWADVVTANSVGALIPLEPFVPKDKLAFLPNPVMTSSTGEGVEYEAPTVVTVGRLVEQKGLDVLLAAWAKVVEVLPDWRLALVGDGPMASELKALARGLKIEGNVDWIGHVSDPYPLLRCAKFFVMTSRFEGMPNALLEAMACGLPAVVSDSSPGPCELIGADESAGLIVPVEDADATAKAIIRLACDETLRRRLGLAARERARVHEPDQAIGVWLRLLRCE